MSALSALLRAERREVLRHRRSALLVLLLVAVPVAALTGGATLRRAIEPDAEARRRALFGASALRLEETAAVPAAALRALVPDGLATLPVTQAVADVASGGRSTPAHVVALPSGALDPDGLARGAWRVVAGRAPADDGEVALSPALAAALGGPSAGAVTVGGRVAHVVGTVVAPERLDLPLALVPSASEAWTSRASLLVDGEPERVAAAAREARSAGASVRTRDEVEGPDGFASSLVFVAGGFATCEAALVVGAAFVVGLRRRRRAFGLLAAQGATAGQLRVALLLSAGALAGAGALLGAALGLLVARSLHPFLDDWTGRVCTPFAWSLDDVLAAVAIGTAAALVAALPSAWHVTGLDVRAALALRRPEPGRAHGALGAGSAAALLGGALVLGGARAVGPAAGTSVLLGSFLALLGLALVTPWILGTCARLAGPLPAAWRLALRDAGRFRTRHGPAVAAVTAAMALSAMLSTLFASVAAGVADVAPGLRDDQVLVHGDGAETIARTFAAGQAADVAPLHAAFDDQGRALRASLGPPGAERRSWLAHGDDALLAALIPDDAAAWSEDAVLVLDTTHTTTEIELFDREGRVTGRLPCRAIAGARRAAPPMALVPASLAARHGLRAGPPPGRASTPWLVRFPRPLDEDDVARARLLAASTDGTAVESGATAPDRAWPRVALALAVLTGAIVIAIATALTSAESDADARTLAGLGAPPSLLRRHAAARAAWLAFVGCALAVPAGLLPAAGTLALAHHEVAPTLVLPLGDFALTLFLLPACAGIAAALAARAPPGRAATRAPR